MHFVIIFGPPAVGKMTVGRELAELAGLKLFHNHMTVDLAWSVFGFDPSFGRLVSDIRKRVFEEVAGSDLPGLIFTFVWGLDLVDDRSFIDQSCATFRARGSDICFVELQADLDERLRRNESASRLAEKPSKRDLDGSRAALLDTERRYRLNTDGDFFYPEQFLKIDNTNVPARDVARRIIETFGLPLV